MTELVAYKVVHWILGGKKTSEVKTKGQHQKIAGRVHKIQVCAGGGSGVGLYIAKNINLLISINFLVLV